MDDSTVFRKVTLLQCRESHSVWQEAFLDSKAFMSYFFHIFIQLPFPFCFDFYPCLTFVFVSVFDNSHHSSFHSVFLPSPRRVAGCVSLSPPRRGALRFQPLKRMQNRSTTTIHTDVLLTDLSVSFSLHFTSLRTRLSLYIHIYPSSLPSFPPPIYVLFFNARKNK